jgi:hypothetical protein
VARKKVQPKNSSWLQWKPLKGEAWLNDFLERLHRAGESTEARVLASIGMRANAYGNKAYAQTIISAARGVLAATSNEDRARELLRYSQRLHWAAFCSGRQDHMDERGQGAHSGLSARKIKLLHAIERLVVEKRIIKLTRGKACAQFIRPALLKEMGLPRDAKWPSVPTIKRAVCEFLEGRLTL